MTSAMGCGMIWVNPELVLVSAEETKCSLGKNYLKALLTLVSNVV